MSFAEGEEDRDWEVRTVDMEELPSTVSCSPATVSVLHGEAGVAAIGDGGAAAVEGDAVHCFFRLQDCWSCDTFLTVGSRVQINARLCPPGSRVSRIPYICTSVWPPSATLPSALALRVLSLPNVREVAQYRATVPGLEPLLPSSEVRGSVRPPPPLVPFDQINIEDQLAASIEELEGKKKKKEKKEKKERRRSRSGEKPMKHLDFLHKINDVIKDLERDAPEVMAKVAQEEEAKQWNTSYPSKADYNAAADPISMAAVGSSSWYGLTVVPGAKPTPLAHQQLDKSQGQLKSKWTEEGEEVLVEVEGEEEAEQEESPVRKQSMFKDIFEEPKEPEERKIEVFSKASKIPPKPSGVGLAEMMKSRLNRAPGGDKVDSEKEVVVEEMSRKRSGERSSSEVRSRSRSWSRSRENKRKSKKKSRSRSKAKKKKKYRSSSSPASSPEKRKKKKKHKVKKEEDENSRSRSGSREEKKKKKKKDRSRSKSTKGKKRKRSQSRSRSKEMKFKKKRFRRRSRSKSYESEEHLKVIPVRRSASRSMSRRLVSRSMSKEVRRSESQSQDAWRKIEGREGYHSTRGSQSRHNSVRRSESRDLDSRGRSVSKEMETAGERRSISRGLRSIASKSRETSQLERIQESSEEEEEDEETIVAKRRLERLKRLAKVKEQKALEEEQAAKVKAQQEAEEARVRAEQEAEEARARAEQEAHEQQEKKAGQNAPVWPPPPPPLQHSEVTPSAAFHLDPVEESNGVEPAQELMLEKLEQEANEEYLKLESEQPKRPVVVTMDAEVLVLINGRSCITQLGAFAWTSYPSFQPLSFFTYLLSDLVRDREALTPASKLTLMDTLRLKTSNFDVTRSGEKQVVYRHPEKGKVGAVEEAEGLQAFMSYLSSLGGPVTLVVHSKDAVLPVLLGLLNEHKIQAEFSKTVTHVCDLVSLAWGFRLDRLWLGKHHPSLRNVSTALVPDILFEDGVLPADRTAAAMWTLMERVRSRDPSTGLLVQAGGQTVVEYLTAKNSLIQAARGDEIVKPPAIEVGMGSGQWGARERLQLIWEKEGVILARDRILERLRESSDRRTPVPDPLNEDDEEAVRIIRTRREEREKEKEKDREEREKARLLRREEEAKERKRRREEKMSEAETITKVARELIGVREEEKLKSYNAFLPAGVLVVPPGGTVTAMLKVPGLKPRMAEVKDKSGIIEQRDELKDATVLATSSLIVQPRDSMFPGIEVTLTSNDTSKELSLDSKIVNYAVATVKI